MDTIYGKLLDIQCRIAYPQIGLTDEQIAKKQANKKGKSKKYKDKKNHVTLLVPKSDKNLFKKITKALLDVSGLDTLEEIAQHPFITKDGDWRDGSDPEHATKAGFAGNIFCKTSTDKDIEMKMINEQGQVVDVPQEKAQSIFYPGANCVVIVQPAAMDGDSDEEVVVTFYLKGIMRLDNKAPRLDGDSAQTTSLFQGYASSSTSEEDSEDGDDAPVVTKPKKAKKKAAPVEDEVDDSDEDDDEVAPPAETKVKTKRSSLSDILDAD